MAVSVDHNGGEHNEAVGLTTVSLATFAVGSGTDRALVASIGSSVTTISGITAKWDNTGTPQSMTQVGSGVDCGDTTNKNIGYVFALLAPTSGTKTLTISWTTSSTVAVAAVSFNGVDQGSVAASFNTIATNTGSSTGPSVTVTSAAGNYTHAIAIAGSDVPAGTNQTQVIAFSGSASDNLAASVATGAASVAYTWVMGSSQKWATQGFNIAATGSLGPQISVQPVSQTVIAGSTATFTITATGTGTLHYQWTLNGSNVGTDSSSYTTAATINTDNLSTVQCVVTDDVTFTNSAGVYLLVIPVGILAWIVA